MNNTLDAMWAEIPAEIQCQALDLLSAVDAAIRPSKLFPPEVQAELPPLGATENETDPFALVKFFLPDGVWTWYAFEFDGDDTFFGLVNGEFDELGYFSLGELQKARGSWGLPVERDLTFEPTRLSELR